MNTKPNRFHNTAHLKPDLPLRSIFPDGRVPIKNFLIPDVVELEGHQSRQTVYMIDLDAITPEQLEKCVDFCHAKANGLARELVRKEIMAAGLPLRSSNVCVTSSNCLAFL